MTELVILLFFVKIDLFHVRFSVRSDINYAIAMHLNEELKALYSLLKTEGKMNTSIGERVDELEKIASASALKHMRQCNAVLEKRVEELEMTASCLIASYRNPAIS